MLQDKVILITGANRGIGLATAQVCIALGATVLLAGRNEVQLELVAEQLGERAIAMCYDLTDETQVKQAFAHIKQHIGHLDGLVNNAGMMHNAPAAMTSLDSLQQQLTLNTVAAFQHIQLASRLMRKPGCGRVVNLCSIVGERGAAGQSAYAASKAALTGITKSLAKELAAQQICVNAVAPGFIDTELHSDFSDKQRENIINTVGLGRMGTPREVADLISFLLSDHAAYITGQIIGIDGGMQL
ncbi:SDR family NAD(P)-dependent oxidoreductase [Alteromonas oceanisediminis]|uniref:SDR family NAD(P)-dependent oxidoreductase n=1 Tax=Alteromonas oceanisediminis TaxID=2836180 RepID=UPI001BDB3B8C|nr:glucose 1-dehydrogenase [Alteromonas oceanisediminis]MBT0584946.1 glucose 1-dehydrogenase [Alteromonas oceanisediminis]